MRKTKLLRIGFSLLTIMLTANISLAQNLIAIQNGNAHSFYTTLDSAITQSQNGDTIYIPGGGYPLTVPINKQLHIYGVGHNPDSSVATNYTIISTDIIILSAASQGSITGIKCIGNLKFGNSQANQNVNNFTVSRCFIQGNISLGFIDTTLGINNVFIENILPGIIDLYYSKSNAFYNNIFNLVKNIGQNNLFRNNIFNMTGQTNYQDGYFWYGCNTSFVNATNTTFENNIFRGRLLSSGGYNIQFSNCSFYNNLFANDGPSGPAYPSCTGCTDFGSILYQPDSTIFIYYPIGQAFSYALNYQLKPTSLGKNAGNDGTDIGIYGGLYPWKDGSIPTNPHIQFKSLSNTTNPYGNLPINIKVTAQDH